MLDRKSSSKVAKAVFYEDFNDIDIFIEDTATGYRKIFKELLKRVFNSDLKIDQVFPVGNRDMVIEECRKNQQPGGRKRIFIVDGDLYLMHENNEIALKGLFILPRYCIENYLIHENSIVDVLYEEDPELEKEQIAQKLGFDSWINSNDTILTELFKYYALCKKHIPMEQTVAYKVSRLCKDDSGELCRIKTQQRIDNLNQLLIAQLGESEFNKEYAKLSNRISQESFKMLKYSSGKDYLFPLINTRLRRIIETKPTNLNLKIRIASKCELNELNDIKNYILQ